MVDRLKVPSHPIRIHKALKKWAKYKKNSFLYRRVWTGPSQTLCQMFVSYLANNSTAQKWKDSRKTFLLSPFSIPVNKLNYYWFKQLLNKTVIDILNFLKQFHCYKGDLNRCKLISELEDEIVAVVNKSLAINNTKNITRKISFNY